MANRRGKGGSSDRFPLKSLWMVTAAMKLEDNCFLTGKLDSVLKSKDITFLSVPYSQGYGLPSNHVWIWELDNKEGREPKNWCFQIVALEKTLESRLESKEIKPVNLKGNQPWILLGRTDAKAEASILWPPDANSWLFGKDPDAGKDWRQRIRGWQKMRWLDGITESLDMNLGELREIVRVREAWHAAIHIGPRRLRHNLVTEQQGVVKTSRLLKEKRLPPQLSCPVSNHIRMLS